MKHPDGTHCEMPGQTSSSCDEQGGIPDGNGAQKRHGESDPDPPSHTNTHPPPSHCDQCHTHQERSHRLEVKRAIVEFLTFVFLVVTVVFTYRLATSARDQALSSKEAADAATVAGKAAKAASLATRAQVRAYEAAEGAQLEILEPTFNFGASELIVTLENYGHVASRRTHGTIFVYGQEGDWFEQPTIKPTTLPFGHDSTEVGPGPQRRYAEAVQVENLDPDTLKFQLFITIGVIYDNGFGQMAQRVACFSLNPSYSPTDWAQNIPRLAQPC